MAHTAALINPPSAFCMGQHYSAWQRAYTFEFEKFILKLGSCRYSLTHAIYIHVYASLVVLSCTLLYPALGQIEETPFSLCVVVPKDSYDCHYSSNSFTSPISAHYHRLDILAAETDLCQQAAQYATTGMEHVKCTYIHVYTCTCTCICINTYMYVYVYCRCIVIEYICMHIRIYMF